MCGVAVSNLCAECGWCCEHEPIEITHLELDELRKANPILSRYLNLTECYDGHFIVNSPCPYRDSTGCLVWTVRPAQCRGYWCFREDPYNEPIDPSRIGNPEYEELRKEYVRDGIEWGRNHGWEIRPE
jgi:Fe-S-cluster containining protein